MPICKNCNIKFPNKIIEDGKKKDLSGRSYCLTCSPRGKNFGYDLRKRSTDEKYKDLYKSENSIVCKICNRHYTRKKKNNLVCGTCRTGYRRYKNKQKGIDLLGAKCSKCSIKDRDVLTFHHVDPNEKSFGLSDNWSGVSWKAIETEIKKCVLLCHNCHMKEHKKDLSVLINFYENPLTNNQG